MAITNITVQKLQDFNEPATAALNTAMVQALDETDGAKIKWDEADEKLLVLVQNSATSAKTLTVKAGNGYAGVNDLEIPVAASSYVFVALESSRFKNVSGDNKDYVMLTGDANLKVAVFKMP